MILKSIAKYCQDQMGSAPRRYLYDRGVNEQSIKSFDLGFCPFEIEGLIEAVGRQNLIDQKVLLETEGNLCCPIRNSIVFPFINQYGKVVSISFRPKQSNEVIKTKKLRKYWHISFQKGSFVYGLNNAIPTIREKEHVIVAEGQFDVIMAHQCGIKNTVSVGGTALSAQQVNILSRYAKRITVIFDGDEGGQRALEKIKERKADGTAIETVGLPEGEDVDSFLRLYGEEAFLKLMSA
jgi:DNA primase